MIKKNKTRTNSNHRRHLEVGFEQLKTHWFSVFDIMDVVVLILDNTAKILYGNAYLAKLLGVPQDKLIGLDWIDQFTPPEVNLKPRFEKNIKQGTIFPHYENEIICRDKRHLIIDWSNAIFHDQMLNIMGVISIGRNVTGERLAEAELRDIKERYDLLFNTMSAGVFYLDGAGKIIAVNPAAERIIGISTGELVGLKHTTSLWTMVYEDGSYCPPGEYPAVIALRTGKPVFNIIRGVKTRVRSELFWVRASAVPEKRNGEVCHAYAIFDDITKEKEHAAEEKRHLEELERMNKLMINREIKMIELKKELEKLKPVESKP
jgi:PAS domain S-box-containing protein